MNSLLCNSNFQVAEWNKHFIRFSMYAEAIIINRYNVYHANKTRRCDIRSASRSIRDLFNVRWKSVKEPHTSRTDTEHPRERSAFADRLSRINIDPFRLEYPLVRHGITESVCTRGRGGDYPGFGEGTREKGIYVWEDEGRAREEHILLRFRSVLQIVVTISCFVRNARARWAKLRAILRELFYLLAR